MWKSWVVGAAFLVACGGEEDPSSAERGVSVRERDEDCAGLSIDRCKSNTACRVISGAAVDDAKRCLGERTELGCIAAQSSCDEALVTFEDPQGKRWVLNDSCSPQGFTSAANATSYPSCTEETSECAAGMTMQSPGCAEPAPTWAKGCYASCNAVGDDVSCAPGFTCQETWVDPCVPKPGETITCAACGSLTHLCLAAPAKPTCAAGTTLVTPGCGSAPTWKEGCYAACTAVGDDTRCAPGFSCQLTSIDPCVPKSSEVATCDACGLQTHLCLAKPTDASTP